VLIFLIFKLKTVFSETLSYAAKLGCFPWLPCFHHSHLLFTYILASVPFLKALFVSFTFLVRIILKYEIHLWSILYTHVEG
uniref:Uncharacterized protein n=1 Tax=Coturnix japonica TaxID=93934 RepID=A0A8C2YAH4_COTJA